MHHPWSIIYDSNEKKTSGIPSLKLKWHLKMHGIRRRSFHFWMCCKGLFLGGKLAVIRWPGDMVLIQRLAPIHLIWWFGKPILWCKNGWSRMVVVGRRFDIQIWYITWKVEGYCSHSHVFFYHGPLLIHLLGVAPSTFHYGAFRKCLRERVGVLIFCWMRWCCEHAASGKKWWWLIKFQHFKWV